MLDRVKELLYPSVSADAKIKAISLFFAKTFESFGSRIESLEARQLQKGDKGDKGDKGKDGKDGKDGLDGKNGLNGINGKDGKDGADGKNGDSITNAEIDFDGRLKITLSNGKEIDAGAFEGSETLVAISKRLANHQITVSATAPTNPQVNDLWFDIS